MTSRQLLSVYKDRLDLYAFLGLDLANNGGRPSDVTNLEIKKHYKILALKYHPDKLQYSENEIQEVENRFHQINRAYSILNDEILRNEYDQWYATTLLNFLPPERQKLADKLKQSESAYATNLNPRHEDLDKYKKYGQTLRKMKQYHIPYGNWKDLPTRPEVAQTLETAYFNKDASTLRVQILNGSLQDFQDASKLKRHLQSSLFEERPVIHECYPSERNDYENDSTLVIYIVFKSPALAAHYFKSQNWPKSVVSVEPRIPINYFSSFKNATELELSLQKAVDNS